MGRCGRAFQDCPKHTLLRNICQQIFLTKSTPIAHFTPSKLIGLDCISGELPLLHLTGRHSAPSCGQAETFQFSLVLVLLTLFNLLVKILFVLIIYIAYRVKNG